MQGKTKNVRTGNGVAQSRINVSNKGFEHVVNVHFNSSRAVNKSQFSISKAELREILASKTVVSSPVTRLQSGAFERIVTLDKPVGSLAEKLGGGQTNTIRVLTDRLGNLRTAHPEAL